MNDKQTSIALKIPVELMKRLDIALAQRNMESATKGEGNKHSRTSLILEAIKDFLKRATR